LKNDIAEQDTDQADGTIVHFFPDNEIFENYRFIDEYIEKMVWNYAYLNAGLTINLNGKKYYSSNGLLDLLENKTSKENCYIQSFT